MTSLPSEREPRVEDSVMPFVDELLKLLLNGTCVVVDDAIIIIVEMHHCAVRARERV